jgi:hypothetical protein
MYKNGRGYKSGIVPKIYPSNILRIYSAMVWVKLHEVEDEPVRSVFLCSLEAGALPSSIQASPNEKLAPLPGTGLEAPNS